MTFADLERILEFVLPKSACIYNAWWANGGHSHASAWLNAGYRVEQVNLSDRTVRFARIDCGAKPMQQASSSMTRTARTPRTAMSAPVEPMPVDSSAKTLTVYGYEFRYLQQLTPECDADGHIVQYYPQSEYGNEKRLPLLCHGTGAFCRFSINAGEWPGVYLWMVDNKIIYIGETEGLQRRFNMGYGHISPRNCYIGGQSTNCKMNQVVLDLYEQGKTVSLYFYKTKDYKQVELILLRNIRTAYNVKDN